MRFHQVWDPDKDRRLEGRKPGSADTDIRRRAAIFGVNAYKGTGDLDEMLPHASLNEAIRKDWEKIRRFIPCRTSTFIETAPGMKKASIWNWGETHTTIDMPRFNGWYVPDGNPFSFPNGKQSVKEDPDALFLEMHDSQRGRIEGAIMRLNQSDITGRVVSISGGITIQTGVMIINTLDKKALLEKADQLEDSARLLVERLGGNLSDEEHAGLIEPILDQASFLRDLVKMSEHMRMKIPDTESK